MKTSKPTRQALVAAMWQAWSAKRDDEYVARGRRLADLSDEHLRKWFVASFKAWAEDPLNDDHSRDAVDADAEFQLRGQVPPYELVRTEIERFKADTLKALDQISESPILREMFENEWREQLEPVLRELLDPNKN